MVEQVYGTIWLKGRRSEPPELIEKFGGGELFVNGEPIKKAWYISTTEGVVKHYNVFGDGKIHNVRDTVFDPTLFPDREVEVLFDGLISETVHGDVRMFFGVIDTIFTAEDKQYCVANSGTVA